MLSLVSGELDGMSVVSSITGLHILRLLGGGGRWLKYQVFVIQRDTFQDVGPHRSFISKNSGHFWLKSGVNSDTISTVVFLLLRYI